MIDTHSHLDGEEFKNDIADVVARAKAENIHKIFLPAIDLKSCHSVIDTCKQFPGYAYPMLGLHPEEVRTDWQEQLHAIHLIVEQSLSGNLGSKVIAIGEVGLDYYWSREFEHEQLLAFEEQVRWSIDMQLPLMIHCRKGQNEMVRLLRQYQDKLVGGVFHCFTGNEHEAEELLSFSNFVLGIGGVLTFKKSNLPETLRNVVPIDRIVLETDAPYMAPVPMRGKRNESSYVRFVCAKLAEIYGLSIEEVDRITTETALRTLPIS